MLIENNKNKVGYGSWYINQSKRDYPEAKDVRDFMRIIREKCEQRIKFMKLKKVDIVRVTSIGGVKPRRFIGEIVNLYGIESYICLKQTKREIHLDITSIDEIDILREDNENIKSSNVVTISEFRSRRKANEKRKV